MRAVLDRFLQDQRGAAAIEYAMIASLISMVIFAAVQNLGQSVLTDLYTKISNAFT
jgi:Flp pilus assembly pilin Flp